METLAIIALVLALALCATYCIWRLFGGRRRVEEQVEETVYYVWREVDLPNNSIRTHKEEVGVHVENKRDIG